MGEQYEVEDGGPVRDDPEYTVHSVKFQDLFRQLADKLDEVERQRVPIPEEVSDRLIEAALGAKAVLDAFDEAAGVRG